MGSLLLLGLVLGMRHALDADHVAAVATLVNQKQSLGQSLKQGGIWGAGHTLTLLLFGTIILFADWMVPEQLVMGLELAVGLMLVLLGLDLLRRLLKGRIHFHSHSHGEAGRHLHIHSHANEDRSQHHCSTHTHEHARGFPLRALLVGMMHGMAGSAAVVVIALGLSSSPWQGILYILVFGVGSVLGMALLSMIISIPLRFSVNRLFRLHHACQVGIGLSTIVMGLLVIYQNSALFPF